MPQYLGPQPKISTISWASMLPFGSGAGRLSGHYMLAGSPGRAAARQARRARRFTYFLIAVGAALIVLGLYGWVVYSITHPSVAAESVLPDPHLLP